MLSKEQVFELFNMSEKKQYQKRGRYLFRFVSEPETILTIVSGKLETMKTAEASDVILRNIEVGSSAEVYIVSEDKFVKRYIAAYSKSYTIDKQTWFEAYARGQVDAFCYEGGTIQFMAPWNELMLCEKGDYIARPIGGEKNDIYRIEKNTFQQTYSLMEEING